jgi:hypothetical protein
MFRFFKGKWISQEEYERKVDCIKSLVDCIKSLEKSEEKDPWEQEVEELRGTLTRSKQKEENEAWVIPFCISELGKLNKKLGEYTPSNPELAELTIQEIVCKLSIEMQIQNNVLMTALRHLMGKTEKTKIEEEEDQEARRREFELEYNKTVEIAKGKDWQHAMFQQYGLRDGKPPTGNDAWVIPYCIDELLKANEELKQDTSKLSLGVQKSNRAFMVALRHLMGKTEKTKIEESELL